ncbi:MAG: hypothetical protein IKT82_03580 [Bacteroidaceae bacterium]|nr:hypothetical protein [Bacteroidaceae bacterium]
MKKMVSSRWGRTENGCVRTTEGGKLGGRISRAPLWAQIAVFLLMIVLVIQIKSSDVQPFIYMQF